MQNIVINDKNSLKYKRTPWNSRAFGFEINEISCINYSNENILKELLFLFKEENENNNVRFSMIRIDSNDHLLKNVLQNEGFYFAETNIVLTINNLQKNDFGAVLRNDLPLTIPDSNDFDQIKHIARTSFHYSRFHEDYNFDQNKVKEKYANWVEDLRLENKPFLIYKNHNEVLSFLAYEVNNDTIDLILGGSLESKGILSYYFYASFMTYFQNIGIKKAITDISAANIGILNLYSLLNFTFKKTLFGFHKFYY